MKKLLILIAFFLVYLHFYPNPQITEFYEQQKQQLLSMFNSATDTKIRLRPEKIYEDLTNKLNTFTEEEQSYLQQLTHSRQEIKAFFEKHCEHKEYNDQLHPKHVTLVCEAIRRHQSLL